jgi:radical SAM superfamily enzyme YgiQ (UPF0313 family)
MIVDMRKKKCLFVHVPLFEKRRFSMAIVPMGCFSMANLLAKNGYDVRIIHLGIEKIAQKKFDLNKYIKKEEHEILCFGIHWHYQLYNTLGIIREIKKANPAVKIIVGGYTATVFAKQIMENYAEIDFIIRGEAEIPLLKFLSSLESPKQYGIIPNLVWRDAGSKVIFNQEYHCASDQELNMFDFESMELLKNHWIYLRLNSPIYESTKSLSGIPDTFMLNVGRGCSRNCFYCGGGQKSQKLINNRSAFNYREANKVFKGIQKIKNDYNPRTLFIDFDPEHDSEYYLELFERIRKNKISIGCAFASWSLPTEEFIKSFARTFDLKHSFIIISPDCANEAIRKRIKGFFFTNSQLMKTLEALDVHHIESQVYFFIGTPFETRKDIEDTLKLQEDILERYENVSKPLIFLPEIEPCSPMCLNPRKYQIKVLRKTFQDYYVYSRFLTLKRRSVGNLAEQLGFISENYKLKDLVCLLKRFPHLHAYKVN